MVKHIKKVASFVLFGVLLLSAVSCGLVYIPDHGREAFESMLPKLFEALDSGDEDAIYNLFSPAIREQSSNLHEQISELTNVYSGPTDEFYLEDGIYTRELIGEPGYQANSSATIPVRSGDDYYWFYIDLMYEHYDENQIGITQLQFYTADEMCSHIESKDKWVEQTGVCLHTDKAFDCEIRSIYSSPHRYTATNQAIDLDEVKEFLKTSNSFAEFAEHFGEPNAEWIYRYYELPKENGKPRYLEISDYDSGEIYSVTIVDDFRFIEVVWDEEEANFSTSSK